MRASQLDAAVAGEEGAVAGVEGVVVFHDGDGGFYGVDGGATAGEGGPAGGEGRGDAVFVLATASSGMAQAPPWMSRMGWFMGGRVLVCGVRFRGRCSGCDG